MGLPGKNTGVGCHDLLQGIFLIQGSNPCLFCLLHWRAGSLPLVPPRKPQRAVYLYTESDTNTIMMLEATGAVVKALTAGPGNRTHPMRKGWLPWENRPCALGKRREDGDGGHRCVGGTHTLRQVPLNPAGKTLRLYYFWHIICKKFREWVMLLSQTALHSELYMLLLLFLKVIELMVKSVSMC